MKTKLLLLQFLVPLFVLAQFTQIGADIDGQVAGDHSGSSVCINSDGSIVAIGAILNDDNGPNSGHVRIYQNTGGAWTQIGTDIEGEAAGDESGTSVSLSADGSIVAIGARFNDGNGFESGHVRVYQNTGGDWTQIGTDIDGEAPEDHSGESVSLSDDGSIVAIGARNNEGNGFKSGHVRIYQNTGNTWTQIGADIDGEAGWDGSGASVSLNADGSIVAIGAPMNSGDEPYSYSGHVRVYQNTGGTWIQVGADIEGEAGEDTMGSSVSLNADGSIVAIGAPGWISWTSPGYVRIYQNTGGTWTQIGEDIVGEEAMDLLGNSVNLSADGSIVAIGAAMSSGNGFKSGHARIYQNTGGTWTQIGENVNGEAGYDESGWSVNLSADGSIVAIAAWKNDGNGSNSGHVRVFDLGIQQTLQASFTSNYTSTCTQDTVEFYDQSAGGAVSWDWAFGGGSPATSTSQNPMVEYFTPGIYDVTLTVGDGVEFSTLTLEDYMTVSSVPDTPETPAGEDEVCTNVTLTSEYVTTETMYAESYEWGILPAEAGTIDGTGITGTVTWTASWEGTASIKVRGINEACGESELSEAFEMECSICTGIAENGDLAGIRVYPNPSDGRFTISGIDEGRNTISIYSLTGKCVYQGDLNIPQSEINASQLPSGIYFYQVYSDTNIIKSGKLIKN